MLAGQVGGCFTHTTDVDIGIFPTDPLVQQCRGLIAIQDDITVVASTCLEAGMKGLIHRLRPLDPHIGGQTGIAAQHPG